MDRNRYLTYSECKESLKHLEIEENILDEKIIKIAYEMAKDIRQKHPSQKSVNDEFIDQIEF